ncbi:MAG: folate-binding protein YgfZ [Acidimicrobiia bacterium]|nr:folate-binding protein YgfZ [Acidimicrobiia bacterium]
MPGQGAGAAGRRRCSAHHDTPRRGVGRAVVTVSESYRADYRELRHGAGGVVTARDLLMLTGPDTAGFLQGQLSQDVADLAPGEVTSSLLLHPAGKLLCRLRVTRTGEERFLCDLASGLGEGARARLERFKLRVAVDLEVRRLTMLSVRGAVAPPPPAAGSAGAPTADGEPAAIVAGVRWGSIGGWDLVAGQVAPPEGVRLCDPATLEAVRIEAGIPEAGKELTDGLIPAEAGIVAETVSFTKGCYVGQELVARIDSRGGNTPRRLRGVVLEGTHPPPAGATITDAGGSNIGRITSSAFSPGFGAAVALAYVHRRVEPPAPARLDGADGRSCEIRVLPLVP